MADEPPVVRPFDAGYLRAGSDALEEGGFIEPGAFRDAAEWMRSKIEARRLTVFSGVPLERLARRMGGNR